VEWAQALEARARLAQLNGLADQVDEVDLLLDLSGDAYRRDEPPGDFDTTQTWDAGAGRLAPDTRMALSSLDKAQDRQFTP
jgi:hypothetical protein